MAEAVKVIVRCRPMNARENSRGCKDVISIDERLAQCSIKNPNDGTVPPKSFTFDGSYGDNSTTQQIYAEIGFPLVEGVTEGYNGTIFAYGQTGSGKSFSMQGITDPPAQRGIIPRAFDHVFEKIQVTEGAKYLVHASYLEIYNEEIRDLLGKDIKQRLELKEHPDKGVYVQNLSMHVCKNVRTCEQVMERGWKNRSTGATLMNARSSRSHSIFTIHVERAETDVNEDEHIRVAKLNLVDLAGSERQGKTATNLTRLKEATKINLSLSALGSVIRTLAGGKSTHIPYRDSKLTRLLQDSLGGNTKTLMVACLSPADNNYEETLSTLRYANRAKNIKNKPKINEDPKESLFQEFQDEIKRLKAMLMGQIPLQLSPVEHDRLKQLPIKFQVHQDVVDRALQSDEIISDDRQEMAGSKTPDVATRLPDNIIKRLTELEQTMVGGEEIHNEEVIERHRKKKKFAEDRSKQLRDALALMDEEETMVGVYENVQDKLRFVEKKLKKETDKSKSFKCEIDDLHSEFELDRRDYLDTIRKQEMQIKWLEAVVDRIHPTLRSGCNFGNLGRIRTQSRWDEDDAVWTLPELTIEKAKSSFSYENIRIDEQMNQTKPRRLLESIYGEIEHEKKLMLKDFEADTRRIKDEGAGAGSSCYDVEVEMFNLRTLYDNKSSEMMELIRRIDDRMPEDTRISKKTRSLKRGLSQSTDIDSSTSDAKKSKVDNSADSETAMLDDSAGSETTMLDDSTDSEHHSYSLPDNWIIRNLRERSERQHSAPASHFMDTEPVACSSQTMDNVTNQQLPAPLRFLRALDAIAFIDMDNWSSKLPDLIRQFPQDILFWLIRGGGNLWREPRDPVYQFAKATGRVFLNQKCGTSKDAADFCICLRVGLMDALLLQQKTIKFVILSGDHGFQEVEEQFSNDQRHVKIISPRGQTMDEICSMIKNVIKLPAKSAPWHEG